MITDPEVISGLPAVGVGSLGSHRGLDDPREVRVTAGRRLTCGGQIGQCVTGNPAAAGAARQRALTFSPGSWILALSILVFIWNAYVTWRSGTRVTEDDPWRYAGRWPRWIPCPEHV
jgi:hypothetical protein